MSTELPEPNSPEEYASWDATPPTRIEHGDPRALIGNTSSHQHIWEARGDFLHCTTGNHGIPYDHINKHFTGTDSAGLPLYETVKIQSHTKKKGKVSIRYHEVDK